MVALTKLGDELLLVLSHAMREWGACRLLGVVSQSHRRAKHILAALNMQAVPTADGEEEGEGEGEMAGGGGEEVVEAGRGREQESEGASERGREESAQALLLKLYLSASPSSISLLGCSQLPSLARFVNEHGALFAEKTLHLTLVGEVKEASLAEEAEAILPANGAEEAFAFLLSEGQVKQAQTWEADATSLTSLGGTCARP